MEEAADHPPAGKVERHVTEHYDGGYEKYEKTEKGTRFPPTEK